MKNVSLFTLIFIEFLNINLDEVIGKNVSFVLCLLSRFFNMKLGEMIVGWLVFEVNNGRR